jgi:hypothetical protein
MLAFERKVVAGLTTSTDPGLRAEVERWVGGTLEDMPEFLRAGVLAESVLFAAVGRLLRRDATSFVASLDASPIGLVRQYVRLFRSLVLFAELELEPVAAP